MLWCIAVGGVGVVGDISRVGAGAGLGFGIDDGIRCCVGYISGVDGVSVSGGVGVGVGAGGVDMCGDGVTG